jgi:hypothetical protein
MNRTNKATGGGFAVTIAAVAMALTVNAIFAAALCATPTSGQRISRLRLEVSHTRYAVAPAAAPLPTRL